MVKQARALQPTGDAVAANQMFKLNKHLQITVRTQRAENELDSDALGSLCCDTTRLTIAWSLRSWLGPGGHMHCNLLTASDRTRPGETTLITHPHSNPLHRHSTPHRT